MPKSEEVDAWFAHYDNPMRDVVLRIREIVLGADPRIAECIKWQAPTFMFEGNLASFFPKSKQHASLMFHEGAKIPGHHPRLEGTGNTSRVLKVASVAEANAARGDLVEIVKAWCAWREGRSTPGKRTASPTAAKPASQANRSAKRSKPAAAKTAAAKKAVPARKAAPKQPAARKAAPASKTASQKPVPATNRTPKPRAATKAPASGKRKPAPKKRRG